MNYSAGIKNDKMRFYQSMEYIGVKTDYPLAKNFCNYDVKTIEIKRFSGKPYNKFDYETYFIFSQNKWDELLKTLESDAKKYNMQVFNNQGMAALAPIWIHSTK